MVLVHRSYDLLVKNGAIRAFIELQNERIMCKKVASFSQDLGAFQVASELPVWNGWISLKDLKQQIDALPETESLGGLLKLVARDPPQAYDSNVLNAPEGNECLANGG